MKLVLTYHALEDSPSPISLPPRVFDAHLKWIARSGFKVLPLVSLLGADDHEKSLAITFDDGFQSFATEAWPRLAQHGFPATVFVVAGHAGGDNLWGGVKVKGIPRLPLMEFETLGRLASEGCGIGSHTVAHPDLCKLSVTQVKDEITKARALIEARTGARAEAFAYPFGEHSSIVRRAVSEVHDLAVTTHLDLCRSGTDPLRIPRVDAWYLQKDSAMDRLGRSTFPIWLLLRRTMRAARRFLRPHGGTSTKFAKTSGSPGVEPKYDACERASQDARTKP